MSKSSLLRSRRCYFVSERILFCFEWISFGFMVKMFFLILPHLSRHNGPGKLRYPNNNGWFKYLCQLMLHMPLWLPILCLLHHTEQCSACGRLFLKRMKTLDCFDCKNCGKKSIFKNFRRSWIRQSAAHSFIIKILLNSIHHRNRFLNRDAPDRI